MHSRSFTTFIPTVLLLSGAFSGALAQGQSPEQTTPPIPLAAYANSVSNNLLIDSKLALEPPVKTDIAAGVLISADHPSLHVVPTIEAAPAIKTDKGWLTPITVTGMIPFGGSDIPIYYKNTKVTTLHVLKTGVVLDSAPAVLQQTVRQKNGELLLVLQNPTGFLYTTVRARLRFKDKDVCVFDVERFPDQGDPAPQNEPSGDCDDVMQWTSFEIPKYAGASLRAKPASEWFVDAGSGASLATRQKGTLTLRFFAQAKDGRAEMVQEQVLPLEIDFQPSTLNRSLDLLWVGLLLAAGAGFSVLLRVAIPNYRRLRGLKEQLMEIRKTIRGISEEVDSMLRVQLHVEHLTLVTLRKSELVFFPNFATVAQRVETAAATLKRRIDFVRRLDAALNRRRLLVVDELAPPSRIATIDRHLTAASEELKSDQFRDEDWVVIQRALETADKTLSPPSEEEKAAFETMLVQRWKSVSSHFNFIPGSPLPVPPGMDGMRACFPDAVALPKQGDSDGGQWIKEIGTVRADLQITALELIREFQFLAPAQYTDHWLLAMGKLTPWLATPALDHLDEARSFLRQLSEGIDPECIIKALQDGGAQIELDPQIAGSGERVHMAVRFWSPNLNSAAARQQITCEWHFKAMKGVQQSGTPQVDLDEQPASAGSGKLPPLGTEPPETPSPADTLFYRERGWEVYHYFDGPIQRFPLEVVFYFDGKPVYAKKGGVETTDPLVYSFPIDLQEESNKRKKQAGNDRWAGAFSGALELFAVLLVPLCALAVSTADQGSSGHWWQLIGLGFGSDTIRNVLTGASGTAPPK